MRQLGFCSTKACVGVTSTQGRRLALMPCYRYAGFTLASASFRDSLETKGQRELCQFRNALRPPVRTSNVRGRICTTRDCDPSLCTVAADQPEGLARRLEVLLRATGLPLKTIPNPEIRIVGNGPEHNRLQTDVFSMATVVRAFCNSES